VTAPHDKSPTSPCKGEVDREAGGRGGVPLFPHKRYHHARAISPRQERYGRALLEQ